MAKGKAASTRASMQNVAAYAGVSIATVSKVMQGVSSVLPENVTKVQNAIEALGYRINPLGAELRRGRRNLIGVIVPTLGDAWASELLKELELSAEARGHVLFMASTHNLEAREMELANRMHDWRVAGVIVYAYESSMSAAALLLESSGLPTVFVQHAKAERRFDTITIDGAMRARDVAATAIAMLFARLDKPDQAPAHATL